jgi:hypothetical protein
MAVLQHSVRFPGGLSTVVGYRGEEGLKVWVCQEHSSSPQPCGWKAAFRSGGRFCCNVFEALRCSALVPPVLVL